ncbi:MAG: TonB-dependent receptor plug domain-containing protein [Gemmatimonadetes bacterium]|nr:TonB-dependent receptor plug domain-containing protein [Gemmatimonadota bacterium]
MLPTLRSRRVWFAALLVAAMPARPLTAQEAPKADVVAPPAIVMGRVIGADKKAIEDVEVLLGDELRRVTDRRGRFSFDPAPAGVRDVLVRKIGFIPVRFRVAVTPGDVWDGTITMERTAQSLPEVVVLDSSALKNYRPKWIDGFLERRRGGLGTFLDRTEIENSRIATTARLVATSPGIITRSGSGWDELNVNRCGSGFGTNSTGVVYVDGVRTETSTTGRFRSFYDYPPFRVWAIEIYKGRNTFPSGFFDPDACLLVLIWTHRR